MSTVGQIEKKTRVRVVALFRKQLGYDYLGSRIDRQHNRELDEPLLRRYLVLRVRPGTCAEAGEEVLNRWHRRQLKAGMSELITPREAIIGVDVAEWGAGQCGRAGAAATSQRARSG